MSGLASSAPEQRERWTASFGDAAPLGIRAIAGDLQVLELSILRPHGRQAEFFGAPVPGEVNQVLWESMQGGLEGYLTVCGAGCASPEYTLLIGHRRREMLLLMGQTYVLCRVVRGLTEEEELAYLIDSNLQHGGTRALSEEQRYLIEKELFTTNVPRRGRRPLGATSPKGKAVDVVAARVGATTQAVKDRQTIFGCSFTPDSMKAAINEGKLGRNVAATMVRSANRAGGVTDEEKQAWLSRRWLERADGAKAGETLDATDIALIDEGEPREEQPPERMRTGASPEARVATTAGGASNPDVRGPLAARSAKFESSREEPDGDDLTPPLLRVKAPPSLPRPEVASLQHGPEEGNSEPDSFAALLTPEVEPSEGNSSIARLVQAVGLACQAFEDFTGMATEDEYESVHVQFEPLERALEEFLDFLNDLPNLVSDETGPNGAEPEDDQVDGVTEGES